MKPSPFDRIENIIADEQVTKPGDVRFMDYRGYVVTLVVFSMLIPATFLFPDNFSWIALLVLITGGVFYSGVFLIRRGQIEFALVKKALKKLANDLGYDYSAEADSSILTRELADPRAGRMPTVKNVMSGRFRNHSFRIFDYTSNQGKNRLMYMIESKNSFPKLVLDSRGDTWSQFKDLLGIAGDDLVELEGNFSKHFFVKIEKVKQQELREILTPDRMAFLEDAGKNFSYYFSENKLYVSHFPLGEEGEGDLSGKETIKLLREIEEIIVKLLPDSDFGY